jgi:hypothetical protein
MLVIAHLLAKNHTIYYYLYEDKYHSHDDVSENISEHNTISINTLTTIPH